MLASSILAATASTATAAEGPCPNEALRESQTYGTRLPDCRAYEQVSPVEKNGGDADGAVNDVESSLSGERFLFLAPAGLPGGPGTGEPDFPFFLSSRGQTGWATQGVDPLVVPNGTVTVFGASPDLSDVAIVGQLVGNSYRGLYIREIPSGRMRLVARPPGTAHVAGYTPDGSRVLFESHDEELVPGFIDESGSNWLYEWNRETGELRLASILPAAEGGAPPTSAAFAGSSNWANVQGSGPENAGGQYYYTLNTLSEAGGRVFFTVLENAGGEPDALYVNESGGTTRISGGHFDAASPSGDQLVVDDGSTLSEDVISAGSPPSVSAADLTPAGSEIQGVLGMGNDGNDVYFAANAILASNPGALGSHATQGNLQGVNTAYPGETNLYVARDGTIEFIAHLDGGFFFEGDLLDYVPSSEETAIAQEKSSRVSADGQTLLFTSHHQDTPYENEGEAEIYRYSTVARRVVCLSCQPDGTTAPTGSASLASSDVGDGQSVVSETTKILRRNLSANGDVAFFQTPDSLVPGDVNALQDVYEWEAAGHESCTAASGSFSVASGGCLYLISSGTSTEPSYFADASENGEDVFIFTGQQLVRQDQDGLIDVYDARVDGGLPAQNTVQAPPCEGESCRAAPTVPPGEAAAGSPTFNGSPNHAAGKKHRRRKRKYARHRRRHAGHSRHRKHRKTGSRRKARK